MSYQGERMTRWPIGGRKCRPEDYLSEVWKIVRYRSKKEQKREKRDRIWRFEKVRKERNVSWRG